MVVTTSKKIMHALRWKDKLPDQAESEGDEWGRKLTILLVCKVAPRAEPKPTVSRPGSFNSFYLNYVFRLCYFISSFRSQGSAQPTLSAFEGMLDPSLVVGPYDKAQSTLNDRFS
jgi:hypothetical protein